MKNFAISAVALAVWAASGGVYAQSLPEPMLDTVRKAIVSNPEVQARWYNFTAAGAERDAVRAGFRPQVDLTYGIGQENNRLPNGERTGWYSRHGGALTINQVLFDGMFTRNEVQRLDYARLVRYYELLEVVESTALEALRAYADVARFSALIEEAKHNYVEHKILADQINARAAAGVGRRVDTEQAVGRLALAESNLLTDVSNLHDVSARFQRVMGVVPPGTLPALRDGMRLEGLPTSVQEAMQKGLPNSPTINAAYENVRATRTEIESRKAGYWPRVDFRIRQSWGSNTSNVAGRSRDTVAEVVLNHNLYRGGADKAREQQAIESNFQARELQEVACRNVRQTLAIAYNDKVRLVEQLKFLDQHRLSTEVARDAYRQQFDIGQRTLLDLLDTQNEYFESTRAYLNAQYDQFISQLRTLAAMGTLTTSLGVSRPDQPTPEQVGQDRGAIPPDELCPLESPVMLDIDKAKAVSEASPRPTRPLSPATPSPAAQQVTLSSDALFDFDSAELKAEGRRNLDELIAQIKTVPLDVAIAVGHTDARGSAAYNQRLSERRAESIKAYMVNQGIPSQRIRTEGRGETQPVASNATPEGRAKNRRVEVTVIQQPR